MDSYLFGIKKSKKEDKSEFLRANKEENAKRKRIKQEQASAQTILAHYRSARTREKVLDDLLADRSKKLSDVQKLKEKLPPQQFAMIANKPSNASRYKEAVMNLGELALWSMEAKDSVFLNVLNKNKEIRASWYVKLKRIVVSVLQVAFGDRDIELDGSQKKNIAEKLLRKAVKINPKEWGTLERSLAKNQELDLSFGKSVKQNIIKAIPSKVLENIIFSSQFKESSFLRRFILKVASERTNISSGEMFLELLGLQSFYEDLKVMNPEKRLNLIQFLIRQLQKEEDNKNKGVDFSGKFLVEIIRFFHFTITNSLLKGLDAKFFETYNAAIIALPASQKLIATVMDIEEEEKAAQQKPSPTKQKVEQLKEIISKDSSMGLPVRQAEIERFCEVISGIFALFTSADFEVFSNLVAKGCETLLLFQESLSSENKTLCKNILAFKLNFYYLPFMCIKRQGYNVKSMLFVPEKYIPIIKVFSKVLHQTLHITDDEEFMGNSDIIKSNILQITKEDFIDIAQFTNTMLYNVIWDRITDYYSVVKPQIRLIKELYNRDSRLKFCPKDFWIIPELAKISQQLLTEPGFKANALEDILDDAPHMLTFETRLNILNRTIEKDKQGYDRFPGFDPELDEDDDDDGEERKKDSKTITIRRQFILEDGFEKISKRKDMRSVFMIRFVNEHGMFEEGIDGGGLLKEFITLEGKIAFDANYGLFLENEDKTLIPNPNSHLHANHLNLFKFLGRLTGKAIYEHILLESVFSVIFLNRILRTPNTVNELKYADPTLYKNLMLLKHRNDVAESLGLTFSVNESAFGTTTTHLLKPDGDRIEVNESNKLEYISLLCNYKLNQSIDKQSLAFLDGLKSTIDLSWVKLFNHEELQYVISGIRKKGFNVEDLKANVEYRGFSNHDSTIRHFWDLLNEMTDDERSLLLLFITGCSRPPTLGFKYMEPRIAIHNYSNHPHDTDKLPTASTCANLFKLPDYKNKELLKKKLMYAINANAGFDLG